MTHFSIEIGITLERAERVRTYQFFPGTGLYVVGVGICVLKRVSEEVSFEASHVRYQSSKVRPFRLFALRAAGVVM